VIGLVDKQSMHETSLRKAFSGSFDVEQCERFMNIYHRVILFLQERSLSARGYM
jgi:hypothetical protein